MKKVSGVFLLVIFLLTGCTSIQEAEKSVFESNNRTEFLKRSYDENYTSAKQVETDILASIYTGNIEVKLSDILGNTTNLETLERSVTNIYTPLNNYVSRYNAYVEEDNSQVTKITIADTIKEGLNVYYFFDDETGKLEQFFVLRAVSGKVYKLSLIWLGGVCYEIK